MKKEAILHIPMSQYAHGIDENHVVFRLRCAKNDLKKCVLFYGDTACRVNPIIFSPVEMEIVVSDLYHDYWQVVLDSPYKRLFYYFQLDDGNEKVLYYGDVFTDHLVDDRSEYFKLPFNHRTDIAKVPDWVNDAIVYNIFPDSFASSEKQISCKECSLEYKGQTVHGKLGGTLWGIADNVNYLEDLGVNCVYLNPIFAAGEYHKYDLLDYYHVDPCFGGDEALHHLVEVLHKHNIRILIDGVFNHCGWYFFAFDDVVKNGEKSRYKDWFYGLKFPVVRPNNQEDYPEYECFAYERMMPKLDTANPEVSKYFCDVGKYWIEKFNIDGWRLDVASEINDQFWRDFRSAIKSSNPDALLIGEVWESANHWLQGDMFDSTMNYDLRKHCRRFFAEGSINAEEFSGRITDMLMRYRAQMIPAQLNLLDSHDVSRFLSLCNGDQRRYCLAILFSMCFVGMPTIFYGDEQGVQGVLENQYRSPMPWNNENKTLYEFFKSIISLRKEYVSLRRGTFKLIEAKDMLLVFERKYEDEIITVAINVSDSIHPFSTESKTILTSNINETTIGSYGYGIFINK